MTVCFADLAGFTRLGEAIPPEDLERVASRFAELAHDAARSPVRFVKSIGDAVMLISFDAVPLLHAVLDLIDAAAENDLPPLRIGVASGLAVSRAGRLVRQSRERGESVSLPKRVLEPSWLPTPPATPPATPRVSSGRRRAHDASKASATK